MKYDRAGCVYLNDELLEIMDTDRREYQFRIFAYEYQGLTDDDLLTITYDNSNSFDNLHIRMKLKDWKLLLSTAVIYNNKWDNANNYYKSIGDTTDESKYPEPERLYLETYPLFEDFEL